MWGTFVSTERELYSTSRSFARHYPLNEFNDLASQLSEGLIDMIEQAQRKGWRKILVNGQISCLLWDTEVQKYRYFYSSPNTSFMRNKILDFNKKWQKTRLFQKLKEGNIVPDYESLIENIAEDTKMIFQFYTDFAVRIGRIV